MVAGGHVWLLGGMPDCQRGACVVAGGHAWLPGGAWLLGGHAWLWEGMHGCGGGYDEIRSMSGRHASYWNAFLFSLLSLIHRYHC